MQSDEGNDLILNKTFSEMIGSTRENIQEMIMSATKLLNKKMNEWLKSFNEDYLCFFCGCIFDKDSIILRESTPNAIIKESKVVIKKDVYLICVDCAKIVSKDLSTLNLKDWFNLPILNRQMEILKTSDIANIEDLIKNRGQARLFIINERRKIKRAKETRK